MLERESQGLPIHGPFLAIHAIHRVSPVSLIAVIIILAGAVLALKGLYLLAGDTEPDGTQRDSIRHRRNRLGK